MHILKTMFSYLKLTYFKKKWRLLNKHNYTIATNFFDHNRVSVGKFSYGPLNVKSWGSKNEKLVIGSFCSIASDVKFILGGEHNYNYITTYPFKAIFNKEVEAKSKGPILIEDFVWIGTNAIILSGVTLGQGSIIGAGTVISSNVEPYSIVAGNPARLIKYRFPNLVISKLLEIDIKNYILENIKNIENIYIEPNQLLEFFQNEEKKVYK